MLNNQWLNTFRTLIDTGHFTKTAKKLYMTQPGVSQHISKLEQMCGHPLIDRIGKSFELTEKGRLVYQYAIKLKTEENILFEKLMVDDPFSGDCYLSCSGSLALKLYSKFLDLQKKHTGLAIHLEASPNYKTLDDIENGEVELGIITDKPDRRVFDYTKIGSEPLCLILPKRYKGQKISVKLLKECGVVNHPDAKMYLSLYFEKCGIKELKLLNIEDIPVISYVNQLGQIPMSVSKGMGFTILPLSALESFGKESSYYIDTPKKTVDEELFLVKKKNRELPSRYKTLENQIRNILRNDFV